ncbi:MAG: hypothetical protein EOP56_17830 [Sphingobacteriales bacterium]|nr:MAG: hypothetical protein EOP56_17830 [Sphingobacteriales bacterium]
MRYLPLILLFLIASCQKEPEMVCDPPLHEGLETFGFVVRDNNYNNLILVNDTSRLDTSGIRVLQPCNDKRGKYLLQEEGIFRFQPYELGTINGPKCNSTIVQWPDYDADTFTYSVSGRPDGCGGTQLYIEPSSLRLNGRVPELDTVLQMGYKAVYTIRK